MTVRFEGRLSLVVEKPSQQTGGCWRGSDGLGTQAPIYRFCSAVAHDVAPCCLAVIPYPSKVVPCHVGVTSGCALLTMLYLRAGLQHLPVQPHGSPVMASKGPDRWLLIGTPSVTRFPDFSIK